MLLPLRGYVFPPELFVTGHSRRMEGAVKVIQERNKTTLTQGRRGQFWSCRHKIFLTALQIHSFFYLFIYLFVIVGVCWACLLCSLIALLLIERPRLDRDSQFLWRQPFHRILLMETRMEARPPQSDSVLRHTIFAACDHIISSYNHTLTCLKANILYIVRNVMFTLLVFTLPCLLCSLVTDSLNSGQGGWWNSHWPFADFENDSHRPAGQSHIAYSV